MDVVTLFTRMNGRDSGINSELESTWGYISSQLVQVLSTLATGNVSMKGCEEVGTESRSLGRGCILGTPQVAMSEPRWIMSSKLEKVC